MGACIAGAARGLTVPTVSAEDRGKRLIPHLPTPRGKLMAGAPLAGMTWFRVGGPADVLFLPADAEDLATFLPGVPSDIPVTVIGVGSNLLVRDGGVRGVVIRLGAGFGAISIEAGERVRAGAAALDMAVARAAQEAGLAGLEFMIGVPGTVGGGLRMNAGAYGGEFKDMLIDARGLDRAGKIRTFAPNDMGFAYRHSAVSDEVIFLDAVFQARRDAPDAIAERMAKITAVRESSQPIRTRTSGSTFKNPDPATTGGRGAWQLVDAAGARGLVRGDAQVSEQHCNFLINRGQASARDLEELGEEVRARVLNATGVTLQWEIKRIGEAA